MPRRGGNKNVEQLILRCLLKHYKMRIFKCILYIHIDKSGHSFEERSMV